MASTRLRQCVRSTPPWAPEHDTPDRGCALTSGPTASLHPQGSTRPRFGLEPTTHKCETVIAGLLVVPPCTVIRRRPRVKTSKVVAVPRQSPSCVLGRPWFLHLGLPRHHDGTCETHHRLPRFLTTRLASAPVDMDATASRAQSGCSGTIVCSACAPPSPTTDGSSELDRSSCYGRVAPRERLAVGTDERVSLPPDHARAC
jgi:hypothetical protein